MDRYVCKQCGRAYNYCRACVLKPIPWRAAGFCSRECSAAFKAPKTEIPEIVEVSTDVINELEVESKSKVKRRPKVQVEPEIQTEDIIEAVPTIEVGTYEPDGIHE